MNTNAKQLIWIVAGGLLTYWLWEKYLRPVLIEGEAGDGGAGGASGNLSAIGGEGGAGGGAGGAGGAGGSGSGGDYAALAAAINALAAGTALPNIQAVTLTVASGTTELVAGQGNKRVCVLAYCVSGAGTPTTRFRSGSSVANLWGIDLSAPSGNSGANLATSWPGYLFATNGGDALNVNVTAPATVSVTYWTEDI